jgi:hypothetical protein
VEGVITRVRIPVVQFVEEPLYKCLEFIRQVTNRSLTRQENESAGQIIFAQMTHSAGEKQVTLQATDVSVHDLLLQISTKTGLELVIADFGIVLKDKPSQIQLQKSANPFEK